MNIEEAMDRILQVLHEVGKEGYVISGELFLINPNLRGRVETLAGLIYGDDPRMVQLTLKTIPTTEPEATFGIGDTPGEALQFAREATNGDLNLEDLKRAGYTGSMCRCGSARMVRRGTCETCEDCGESNGCS